MRGDPSVRTGKPLAADRGLVVRAMGPGPAQGTANHRAQIADSVLPVTLIDPNVSRIAAVIVNASTSVLYIGLGGTAPTLLNWTFRLEQWDAVIIDNSVELIAGIWSAATVAGYAACTEIT
jgi:hypothetical protein